MIKRYRAREGIRTEVPCDEREPPIIIKKIWHLMTSRRGSLVEAIRVYNKPPPPHGALAAAAGLLFDAYL